jgi:hypothetical protein
VPEKINLAVEWLIAWTLGLESDKARIHQVLDIGLNLARSSHKPVDAGRPAMNGFKFIEEIMKGNLRS